jgi:hypothetical protein
VSAPTPAQRRRRSLAPKARKTFLAALTEGYSVTHAAERAGHHRRRFYDAREADADFADAWLDALEQGTDLLEDELRRRALGYDEVTYDGDGKPFRTVHRHDTRALELTLKARRPHLYRENVQRVELTGADGGPVAIEGFTPTTLADVLRLARELGVDEIEGEAIEVPVAELEAQA